MARSETTTAPQGWFRGLRASPARLSTWLAVGLITLGTVVRIPQLFHTLVEEHEFRQTQTAYTARFFAEHVINLFSSPLPIFGPDANVPLEFPVFQATAALLERIGLGADVAPRLLGLISFQAAAILLVILVRRWHGRAVAVVALVLYEFLPFSLFWGAASLIDFTSVAFALGMVLCLDLWFDRGKWWWLVLGAASATLCALVKITTFPGWGILVLAAAIVMVRREGFRRSWGRLVLGLVAAPGVAFGIAALWTRYADAVKAAQPDESVSSLVSSALTNWTFAYPGQRTDPEVYLQIASRVSEAIAGPALIGAVIAIIAALLTPGFANRVRAWAWIAVSVAAPLVFLNLYYRHSYYLIGVFPAIVTATAIGLVWLWRRTKRAWKRPLLAGAIGFAIFVLMVATSPLSQNYLHQFLHGGQVPDSVTTLEQESRPTDLIVVVGCDWDPTTLYYAHREGVMFPGTDAGDFWQHHPGTGYQWLFDCGTGLDADGLRAYLPPGSTAEPTEHPFLFRIR